MVNEYFSGPPGGSVPPNMQSPNAPGMNAAAPGGMSNGPPTNNMKCTGGKIFLPPVHASGGNDANSGGNNVNLSAQQTLGGAGTGPSGGGLIQPNGATMGLGPNMGPHNNNSNLMGQMGSGGHPSMGPNGGQINNMNAPMNSMINSGPNGMGMGNNMGPNIPMMRQDQAKYMQQQQQQQMMRAQAMHMNSGKNRPPPPEYKQSSQMMHHFPRVGKPDPNAIYPDPMMQSNRGFPNANAAAAANNMRRVSQQPIPPSGK